MSVHGKKRKTETASLSIPIVKKTDDKKSQHRRLRRNNKLSRRKAKRMWWTEITERKYIMEEEMFNSVELWRQGKYNNDPRVTTDGVVRVEWKPDWSGLGENRKELNKGSQNISWGILQNRTME